jgi:hypothetical protein|tara:strand:- start:338 stop:505 length:168 start_codon:yes stop_codon:yes gene_type:complete
MKKWIKENGWLAFMAIGSSMLFWTLSTGGEAFIGQIPVACMLIIIGVSLSSNNKN